MRSILLIAAAATALVAGTVGASAQANWRIQQRGFIESNGGDPLTYPHYGPYYGGYYSGYRDYGYYPGYREYRDDGAFAFAPRSYWRRHWHHW